MCVYIYDAALPVPPPPIWGMGLQIHGVYWVYVIIYRYKGSDDPHMGGKGIYRCV